jgi:hypothetical protein
MIELPGVRAIEGTLNLLIPVDSGLRLYIWLS